MELNQHDKAVLNFIFNPCFPDEAGLEDNKQLEDVEDDSLPDVRKSTQLELEAVELAEVGNFENALTTINRVIEIDPNRASLYNNRARIHQFQRNFDDAMEDVTKAINLAKNTKLGKTLCQAHLQRGVLYRRNGQVQKARDDFQIASNMGSTFAKKQLVELNPQAALCNQMLSQVMDMIS